MSEELKKFKLTNDITPDKIKDFELLRQIVMRETNISSFDISTKNRIMQLCDEQLQIVNRRIEDVRAKNDILKNHLESLK